jgi:queuine tRNA-ribosyltransferase
MKEMLGGILLSIHNLHYLLDLTAKARAAIESGGYGRLLAEWLESPAAYDY